MGSGPMKDGSTTGTFEHRKLKEKHLEWMNHAPTITSRELRNQYRETRVKKVASSHDEAQAMCSPDGGIAVLTWANLRLLATRVAPCDRFWSSPRTPFPLAVDSVVNRVDFLASDRYRSGNVKGAVGRRSC